MLFLHQIRLMVFLYPNVLWGLTLVLIPIIIHLIQVRRYELLPFSNLKFLRALVMKKRNLRRWEEYLILLLRCLAILFLVIAFAQPDTQNKGKDAANKAYHYFILDASASFALENEEGILWDQEKEHAYEMIQNLPAGAQIKLCLDKIPSRWMNKSQALIYVKELQKSVAYVLNADFFDALYQDVLREDIFDQTQVWWFTDGQVEELNREGNNLPINLLFYPNEGVTQNIAIESLRFGAPIHKLNGNEVLNIQLSNPGDEDLKTSLIVRNQLELLGQMELMLPAREKLDTQLTFKNNPNLLSHEISVKIEDQGYQMDNTFYAAYSCAQKIVIYELIGADQKEVFQYLFNDSVYQFKSDVIERADYDLIQQADLVILNGLNELPSSMSGLLSQRVQNEQAIYWIPAEDLNMANQTLVAWSDFKLKSEQKAEIYISNPPSDHPFYQGVYLDQPKNGLGAKVNRYYDSDQFFTSDQVLLKSNTGQSLLHQEGKTFYQYFALTDSASNFMDHALFVTLALRISEESILSQPVYYYSGQELNYPISTQSPFEGKEQLQLFQDSVVYSVQLRKKEGRTEIYAPLSVEMKPGFYFLKADEFQSSAIAINADRSESKTPLLSLDSLSFRLMDQGFELIQSSEQKGFENDFEMEAMNELSIYTKFSLIFALIFLLIEITLIKFWIR